MPFYKTIFLAWHFPMHTASAQKPLHANALWAVEKVAPEVLLAGRKEGRKVVLSLSFHQRLHLSPMMVACHWREQSGVPKGSLRSQLPPSGQSKSRPLGDKSPSDDNVS